MQSDQETTLSDRARSRFEQLEGSPPFTSDWLNTVMIHFAVDPSELQQVVPFELDLHDGGAFVSLVAFDMVGLRPTRCERMGKRLFAPLGSHPFLNVRTYVRHNGETGIFFLTEFLPNILSVPLGPVVYGLPYRYGRIAYHNQPDDFGFISGRVRARRGGSSIVYHGRVTTSTYEPSKRASLTEFLMERYTAFTKWCGISRRFRIWHKPWQQATVDIHIDDDALLQAMPDWYVGAALCGANCSPGAVGVWMGRPRALRGESMSMRCPMSPIRKAVI